MSQSCKTIHCYQQSKGRAGEVKAEERSTSCIFSIKKQCYKKNQLYKTAKKELNNDPDDEDKHEVEKHFHTTVNFLCQKYGKMKKQVGYESE